MLQKVQEYEFYVLLECPDYEEIKIKYLPDYYTYPTKEN